MITGLPMGLGGPLFEGFDGALAFGLFGIPGVKGVEFGDGFAAARRSGSAENDPWEPQQSAPGAAPASNHSGGIAGGMTTSAPILFRAAMKPTPSIALRQQTVSLEAGTAAELIVTGRHDPCIGIRAVPVVEAVAALAALDLLLAPPAVLSKDLPNAECWASAALKARAENTAQ